MPNGDTPLVALVADNPFRDLPGIALTAWHLCQRGLSCCIVPMNVQETELWNMVPDYVVLNYLRKNNEDMAARFMDAGVAVAVLDTEGAIFTPRKEGEDPAEEYALTMARRDEVRARVVSYFAWTPDFADFVARKGWYAKDRLCVTGSPRTDYYHATWRAATLARTRFIDAFQKPLFLINGSFPTSNPKFQSAEREKEQLIKTFSFDAAYVETWQRNERLCVRELAALANRLARRFPEATFVYRPHPFENESTYLFLLDPLPNLSLVKRGTVDGWLLRASGLIHVSSSTAIEASLCGIPVMSPAWLPKLPVPLADAVTHEYASADRMEEAVGSILAGSFAEDPAIQRRRSDVVRTAYHEVDGHASERIADIIARQASAGGRAERVAALRRYAYGTAFTWEPRRRRILRRMRERLNLPVHWSFRHCKEVWDEDIPWDRTDKRFGVEDVQEHIDAIRQASASSKPVQVRTAENAGWYRFGYRQGRSIAVTL